MYQNGPERILGQIGAIQTFIENFPMSILDLSHGKIYTSVFDFLIDVLEACGVSVYDIVNILLEKIFGVEGGVEGSVNAVYDKISNLEVDEQSQFMRGLEATTKSIIFALLSSIFSCSAIPILPTSLMDKRSFKMNSDYRNYIKTVGGGIAIPYSSLNMFGGLNYSPFSNAGKMFYNIKGGDKYYVKKHYTTYKEPVRINVNEPHKSQNERVYMVFGGGHADFLADTTATFQDEILFRLSAPSEDDIKITVKYKPLGEGEKIETFTIEAGQFESDLFIITAVDKTPSKNMSIIEKICLEENESGHQYGGTYFYLSKNDSMDVVSFWNKQGNQTMNKATLWGSATTDSTADTETENEEVEYYQYEEIGHPVENAVRQNGVPTEPNVDSPEYIVSYYGLDPNTLYKSDDMNAFLWYIYNRSSEYPQAEVNKNVWDSRIYAKSYGVERVSPSDWNSWYNSRQKEDPNGPLNDGEELSMSDGESGQYNVLYPILQFSKINGGVEVKFPAQTYFKPKSTKDESTSDDDAIRFKYRNLRLNASLFKFNYDYLQNIKIFDTKRILYGLFDGILNGAMSAFLGIHLDFESYEMDAMLSSAIKKYIEAEDMETEDCYFKFSNEEFDNMLNDMLLSRYAATKTGGENNRAVQYDVQDYINQIDSVNFSASSDGQTTKIMKMVTDVSVPSVEGENTIEYGVKLSFDKGFLKKIIWAMALPIVKSLFTPQLILLFLINFRIMGITSLEDLWGNNQSAIVRLITNKLLTLVRSIISFIKDSIVDILMQLFLSVVQTILYRMAMLRLKEELEDWMILLRSAIACLPRFRFGGGRNISQLDEVNYADIINEQRLPETAGGC